MARTHGLEPEAAAFTGAPLPARRPRLLSLACAIPWIKLSLAPQQLWQGAIKALTYWVTWVVGITEALKYFGNMTDGFGGHATATP